MNAYRIPTASIALATLVALSAPAIAAQGNSGNAQGNHAGKSSGPAGGESGSRIDKLMERLDETLSLSDEQESQLRDVFTEHHQELRALRDERREGGDRQQLREKVRELRDALDAEVKEILDDDQYQTWTETRDELRQEGRKRMRERRAR